MSNLPEASGKGSNRPQVSRVLVPCFSHHTQLSPCYPQHPLGVPHLPMAQGRRAPGQCTWMQEM